MLSLESDPENPSAKMPCGHVISTTSMTMFLRSLVQNKNHIIRCPGRVADGTQCSSIWPFKQCQKIGVLTEDETKEFEEGFAQITAFAELGAKQCPTC